MYNLIRQIHLFAAFILMAFVLMYFITGFVMIFEQSFHRKDTSVETVSMVIDGVRQLRGDTLISALRRNFQVSGQYRINKNDRRTMVDFRHPGTEINVIIPYDSDSVKVTTKNKNFAGVMHHFHRIHGYYGGWNYLVWAFVYDLSSISMIVFAITGVYLWYKTERNKLPGWLILVGFTIFTAFSVIYLGYLQ